MVFIKLDHSLLLLFFLDYHRLNWKCLIYYMIIKWHYLLLPTIHEWNVKKTQINNTFESILDEDIPYSIVVKNITAEETRDMFKAFAMDFFVFFLYIIYSIFSIRKSLKQHFFTNSEAVTAGVMWEKVLLEISQN